MDYGIFQLGPTLRSKPSFPCNASLKRVVQFHGETTGLEGGASSIGVEGQNYGKGVVKFLGMMKFK